MYPSAPWNLYGEALQSLHLIDVARAQAFVPPDLEIITVLPGKTLGGLYFSTYEGKSTLKYHELIVVAALVRYNGTLGAWISHIYVDHSESMLGGRNIWGLPKELADFTWQDAAVKVAQGQTTLCQIQYNSVGLPLDLWGKTKISGNVFSGLEADILQFQGDFAARLKWIHCDLAIPAESPFAAIGFGRPWGTIQLSTLHLTANIPSVVGKWVARPSCIGRSTAGT